MLKKVLEILPGITTSGGNNWRAQVVSLWQLKVFKVALFPTTLNEEERKDLRGMLKERPWVLCPAVHARDDMERWEYEEFQTLGAQVFNLHATPRALRFVQQNPDIAKQIFVENGSEIDDVYWEMLEICGGACVDLAHLEDFGFRQKRSGYQRLIDELPGIRVGMTHIAAVWEKPRETSTSDGTGLHMSFEEHYIDRFPDDLEYLWRPDMIDAIVRCDYNCIELTDTIGLQLAYAEYIKKGVSRYGLTE